MNPKDLIKKFEGLKLDGYLDSKNILTIGYGHRVLPKEPYKLGKKITLEEAERLFEKDFDRTERAVNALIHVNLNHNQVTALTCLAFNIGTGALERSTLLRLVNTTRLLEAADEFLKWEMTGIVKNKGLALRREAERKLFLTPYIA